MIGGIGPVELLIMFGPVIILPVVTLIVLFFVLRLLMRAVTALETIAEIEVLSTKTKDL